MQAKIRGSFSFLEHRREQISQDSSHIDGTEFGCEWTNKALGDAEISEDARAKILHRNAEAMMSRGRKGSAARNGRRVTLAWVGTS